MAAIFGTKMEIPVVLSIFSLLRSAICAITFEDLDISILHLSDKQIDHMGGWRSDYVMRSHYMHSMRDAEAADLVAQSLTGVLSGVLSTDNMNRKNAIHSDKIVSISKRRKRA